MSNTKLLSRAQELASATPATEAEIQAAEAAMQAILDDCETQTGAGVWDILGPIFEAQGSDQDVTEVPGHTWLLANLPKLIERQEHLRLVRGW